MRFSKILFCFSLLTMGCAASKPDIEKIVSKTHPLAKCEIMHAVFPHPKSIEFTGKERLLETRKFGFDDKAKLIGTFKQQTMDIIGETAVINNSMQIVKHELVLGGYEGKTIPSVVMHALINDPSGFDSLLEIAANIGYVYAQDSTLIICDAAPKNGWQKLTSINMTDSGVETFFTEENVPLFYGMMIGKVNSLENLGYTFYRDSKTFSTFAGGESEENIKEKKVMTQLSSWLEKLSNSEVKLDISTNPVWVFFPHNDWKKYPKGEAYIQYMKDGKVSSAIRLQRQKHLKVLDTHLLEMKH